MKNIEARALYSDGRLIDHTIFIYRNVATTRAVLLLQDSRSEPTVYDEYADVISDRKGTVAMRVTVGAEGLTEKDQLKDAVTAYDYLHFGRSIERVGVISASYAGNLALLLSQQRPVHKLLLHTPELHEDGTEAMQNYTGELTVTDSEAFPLFVANWAAELPPAYPHG